MHNEMMLGLTDERVVEGDGDEAERQRHEGRGGEQQLRGRHRQPGPYQLRGPGQLVNQKLFGMGKDLVLGAGCQG